MTITTSYLKLTVSDIFSAAAAVQDEAYFSLESVCDDEDRPLAFANVRFSGLVIQAHGSAFHVDDGTGVIRVDSGSDGAPAVGDYVEVLGRLQGNVNRSVSAMCCVVKNDPMEEVKYLLEQAAIHRSRVLWKNANQERFLSSDTSVTTGFDRLSDQVTELITGRPDGVRYEEVKEICGNDEITKRIISVLENTGIIYSSKDLYYPL